MATPQESTTTVSGRRCTRSRARTAATSITSAAAAITSTELTSSTTTTSTVQQVQSSAAEAPPPPPPSSTVVQAPAIGSTSAATASSAIGTDSPVPLSVAQSSAALASLAPSPPAAVVPVPGAAVSETAAVASAAAEIPAAPSTTSAPTGSDSNNAAVTSIPLISSISSSPAAPAESSVQSSIVVAPNQPAQSTIPSDHSPNGQPHDPQTHDPQTHDPQTHDPGSHEPQSTETGIPSGGSAGIISPDQGSGNGAGLTIASDARANVGGIVGGVVGGLFGLALISALVFLCLRRRRSIEKWRQRVNEKDEGGSGFLAKGKAIPGGFAVIPEKAKSIPASIGVFFAKMKGDKSGPAENPYRRHNVRSSVSSVYSEQSNGRSRSISEPSSKFRQQLRGFSGRMPSLKRSKTLLQKKPDSLVVGSKSPFPEIVKDPVVRNSKDVNNPFADPEPEPLEPPKHLFVLNPDPASREGSPNLQRSFVDGLRDQQRAPITPKPTAMSDRGSIDPLASMLDELDERDGSGTPEWLRDTSHKRTQSADTALRSHPPSSYTASIYSTTDNPFLDPSEGPPVPSQPLPPNPPIRPTNAYTGLPIFNTTSSAASRESNASFFFGEPGPSRPTTNMFPNPPRIRQSDPFDLDRPEVLGFGNVAGRREVRASVTRHNSRSNRRSSVPNWVNFDDSPYERASAVPGPLRRPSVRR